MENEQVKLDEQVKQDCPDHKDLEQQEVREEIKEEVIITEFEYNKIINLVHHTLEGCLTGLKDHICLVYSDCSPEEFLKVKKAIAESCAYLMANETARTDESIREDIKKSLDELTKIAIEKKNKIKEENEKIFNAIDSIAKVVKNKN